MTTFVAPPETPTPLTAKQTLIVHSLCHWDPSRDSRARDLETTSPAPTYSLLPAPTHLTIQYFPIIKPSDTLNTVITFMYFGGCQQQLMHYKVQLFVFTWNCMLRGFLFVFVVVVV